MLDYTLLTGGSTVTLQCDRTYIVLGPVNVTTLVIEGGTVVKYTNATTSAYILANALTCKTAPYRPAVFTAKDDDSVGENLPNSPDAPNGFYGTPALRVNFYGTTLEHVRFAWSKTGVQYEPTPYWTSQTLRHAQFVNCETALKVTGYSTQYPANLYAGNLLIAGGSKGFDGECYAITTEHLTAAGVTTLASATGYPTCPPWVAVYNSVLANVTTWAVSPATVSGTHNGFYSNPAGEFGTPRSTATSNPFQTVGAGQYYLATSAPFFNVGKTTINATLLDHLKRKTTSPPAVRTTPITYDTVLSLRAERDTELPDLGWHYDPLDLVVSGVSVTGATLTLTNGVAVGVYGTYGVQLGTGSKLFSAGTPTNLNRVLWYNAVQEQSSSPWSGPPGQSVNISFPLSAPFPEVDCRFTQWSMLGIAYQGCHVYCMPELATTMTFVDCQFGGGGLDISRSPTLFKNCLLERVSLILDDKSSTPARSFYNNLFLGGSVAFDANGGTWIVKDNLFDRTTIPPGTGPGITHDHNGYVTGQPTLTPLLVPPDVVLSASPNYPSGTLGRFYLPSSSPLINAGSRPAGEAGLYHYTVKTTNLKEGADTPATVDIGFHYVACASGKPIDTDAGGLADYLEDSNGDGDLDDGETSITLPDSDTDGLSDLNEWELQFNVQVNDPDADYGNEQNTQFESTCAVVNGKVVVAYVDSNLGVYGLGYFYSLLPRTQQFLGYSFSAFGGTAFVDQGVPPLWTHDPSTNADDGDLGDPVLAVDPTLGPMGTVYLVGTSPRHTGHKGFPLWKSTDGGRTFGTPTTIRDDILGSDKPWIAVDTAAGTGQNDVYLVCQRLDAQGGLWLTVSTDGSGGNWGAPISIRATGGGVQTVASAIIVLGSNHTGYVVWFETATGGQNRLMTCTVQIHASPPAPPLGAVTTVRQLVRVGGRYGDLELKRSSSADESDTFSAYPFPVVAVNPSPAKANHLYVAYADRGDGDDKADVYLVCSRNGGASWDDRRRISTTPAKDQWMPVLAVKPDGTRLFLAWYDRREDEHNSLIHVYGRWATIAADGTVSFDPKDFRITTESFAPVFAGTLPANRDPGHYDPVYPPGSVNLHWWYDPEWPPPDEFGALPSHRGRKPGRTLGFS